MPALPARSVLPLVALALTACASLNTVDSEVASYGQWPAGRSPGTYTIERLPSQQARAPQADQLEAAARTAIEQAGFKPAADPASADVVVQLGARITRTDYAAWDDPLWWRWSGPYWYRPIGWRAGYPGWGWGWPMHVQSQYSREVAVLLRDRHSGQPLYEARAVNDGITSGGTTMLAAMFQAALKDFPNTVPEPHRVSVQLAGSPTP